MNRELLQTTADLDELIGELAERYAAALRAGKKPDIEEYTRQYPEAAAAIRQILPALEVMASVAGDEDSQDGEIDLHVSNRELGDFRIVREIGRGGMGVVYEAEQLSIGRRVALKVLPFASILDKQQLNRFKNEARAAGTLDHPNIVAIHSVGCDRGVHYYAMQLVEGQSLAQVIEKLRQSHLPLPPGEGRGEGQVGAASRAGLADDVDTSDSKPARTSASSVEPLAGPTADTEPAARLTTLPEFDSHEYFRSVAKLGIQAAEALDHAHQNGILHRDIKPANLLVDDAGKLWITDFGLARMEQDAGMTMTGDILGTLRYLSPEQALAKRVVVDHRSDIYSLGVTLYELLTLQPAYSGDDRHELLRQIAFEEPRRPREVSPRIPLDLETIVLKAIEKNPAQRYTTAHDLAADLRNFVENQPIKAKPPSWRDRVVKWARRHPAGVRTALVSVLMTTIVFAGSAGWVYRDRAAREAILGEQISLALEEAKTWFEAGKLNDALSAIKRADGFVASGRVSDALIQRVYQWRLDVETVQKLEQIRSDRAGVTLGRQPVDAAVVDEIYCTVFREYGIDLESLTPGDAAQRIKASPIREALVAALQDWHGIETLRGETSRRISPNEICRLADDDPWRERVRDANKRHDHALLVELAAEPQSVNQPTSFIVFLAYALKRCEHPAEAIDLLKRAQWRNPTDFWINIELANCLRGLKPPRTEEAIGYRRVAVALRPESPFAYDHLAIALRAEGRFDEAEAAYRESIRLAPRNSFDYHNLFLLLWSQGKREEAKEIFRQAPPLSDAPENLNTYGIVLENLEKLEEAEKAFREAIEIAPDAWAYFRLGVVYEKMQRYSESEVAFDEAIRLNPKDPEVFRELGLVLIRQEKYPDAELQLLKATELDPENGECFSMLGFALFKQAKLAEAKLALRQAIRLKADGYRPFECLAEIFEMEGQFDETKALYEEALTSIPDSEIIMNNLAWLLATAPKDELRDGKRAIELATRACELTTYRNANIVGTLAAAYAEAGDFKAAVEWGNKAIELTDHDEIRDSLTKQLDSFRAGRPWREPIQKEAFKSEATNPLN